MHTIIILMEQSSVECHDYSNSNAENFKLMTDYWLLILMSSVICMHDFVFKSPTNSLSKLKCSKCSKALAVCLFIQLRWAIHIDSWYVHNILANNFELATILLVDEPLKFPTYRKIDWRRLCYMHYAFYDFCLCAYLNSIGLLPVFRFYSLSNHRDSIFKSFDKYLIWGGNEPSPLSRSHSKQFILFKWIRIINLKNIELHY